MLIVGLTGGIGSGKTSAANFFSALGACVIDTDLISHALTQPGGAAIGMIRQAFGELFVSPDGVLDRKQMRKFVFSDTNARYRLEAILHPLIRDEVSRRIANSSGSYIILVVPLLLETGSYRNVIRRILVIDCSESKQIARAMARSGLTEEDVRSIMNAQLPRNERLLRADDVILNDDDVANLERQVEALHKRYLVLAGRS
jgi:dephospho-CoA kinase